MDDEGTGSHGDVGERIREARKGAGISLTNLARKMGVPLLQVLKWTRGEEKPSDQQLNEISGHTKFEDLDWLLTGVKSPRYFQDQNSPSTFFCKPPRIKKGVYHLGYYFPSAVLCCAGDWKKEVLEKTNYPDHTREVLNLKNKSPVAIDFFFQKLEMCLKLAGGFSIAVIPSSSPENSNIGISQLGQRLSRNWNGINDATEALIRKYALGKKSLGGSRDFNVEFKSLKLNDPALIVDQNVLLLDDVTTSGTSMSASEKHLIEGGAKTVVCLALTKTLNNWWSYEGEDF
tara:strand:- start:340 stop:1203 length:864 start_codon:yes stop_codon:yes gene_type:complete